jgi:hypothetical protein
MLLDYAKRNMISQVKKILKEEPEHEEITAAMIAAMLAGHRSMVKLLIKSGADMRRKTAVYQDISAKKKSVREITAAGALIDAVDIGDTAMVKLVAPAIPSPELDAVLGEIPEDGKAHQFITRVLTKRRKAEEKAAAKEAKVKAKAEAKASKERKYEVPPGEQVPEPVK